MPQLAAAGGAKKGPANAQQAQLAGRPAQHVGLRRATMPAGGMRGRRDSGDVTPTTSKNDTLHPEDLERLTIGALENDRGGAGSGTKTPKQSEEAPKELDNYVYRKSPREKQRGKFKSDAVGFGMDDGPSFKPNLTKWTSAPARYNPEDSFTISYAQMARPAVQRQTIQISPRPSVWPPGSPVPSLHQRDISISRETSDELVSNPPSPVFSAGAGSDTDSELDPLHSGLTSIQSQNSDGADERLTHPREYFAGLRKLESSVSSLASLDILSRKQRQKYPRNGHFDLQAQFPPRKGLTGDYKQAKDHDDEVSSFLNEANYGPVSRNASAESANAGLEYWAFHILECRNVMLRIMSNIELMSKRRFLNRSFSLLALDPSRGNVADLVSVELDWLYGLHQNFETALNHACSLLRSSRPQRSTRIREIRDSITQPCEYFLRKCHLPTNGSVASIWRRAVMLLNLAVVSYSGAHQKRFDLEQLQESLDNAKMTPAWTYDSGLRNTVMLKYRRLKCLDTMLQTPVWVFQDSTTWQQSEALYVSTDIETFADIWGPSWVLKASADSPQIFGYEVNGGLLLPQIKPVPAIKTLGDETLFHWHPETDFEILRDVDSVNKPAEQVMPAQIAPPSKLLIGGGPVLEVATSQLKETPSCPSRTPRVIHELRSRNLISERGTAPDKEYLAQKAYSASVGYQAFGLSASRMYKRQSGVTYKQAIREAWKHSESSRQEGIMEQWLGVEVSFCSGNARRRRLCDVMKSHTMRHWLDSCLTHTPVCLKAFRAALEDDDPTAFRRLWRAHVEWREDLRHLVSICLEGLSASRVDEEGTLHLLWMPRADKPYIVKVKQARHAWTTLLADSEEHASFAVMSGKCLYTDYADAAVCSANYANLTSFPQPPSVASGPGSRANANASTKSGIGADKASYTIFETAVIINEAAYKPRGLELRPPPAGRGGGNLSRYSIASIRANDKLPMLAGRLRVRETWFKDTRLLVEWEPTGVGDNVARKLQGAMNSVSKSVGGQAGRERAERAELHHWELLYDGDIPVKPVPVFVISQNRAN